MGQSFLEINLPCVCLRVNKEKHWERWSFPKRMGFLLAGVPSPKSPPSGHAPLIPVNDSVSAPLGVGSGSGTQWVLSTRFLHRYADSVVRREAEKRKRATRPEWLKAQNGFLYWGVRSDIAFSGLFVCGIQDNRSHPQK